MPGGCFRMNSQPGRPPPLDAVENWRTVWFSWETVAAGTESTPRRAPEALGGGADIRVALPEPEVQPRYERLCTTSEALIYAAMGRLMLRRLARKVTSQIVLLMDGAAEDVAHLA